MTLAGAVVPPYSPAVPVTVADVLGEKSLRLRLVAGPRDALAAPVRWVAVTELPDPRPFLAGGELVLTTGLRQRAVADQRRFVERLAERDAVALGFATGLTHTAVPDAVVAAAESAALPVLEVPYETPFIAVDRFVADRVLEAHYGRFRDLLERHDALSRALLSGQGLAAVVDRLRSYVGGEVAVVDRTGGVLASAPPAAAWPADELAEVRVEPAAVPAGAALVALPVEVEGVVVAHVCLRRPARALDVLPYAVTLIGLELARRQAVLTGRRQLLGQVLEDVVRGLVSPVEAERRLSASGLDPAATHRVVLGEVVPGYPVPAEEVRGRGAPPDVVPVSEAPRVARLPWVVRPGVLTAIVGSQLAVLAREDQPVHELARLLHDQLRAAGARAAVGIGGAYPGVAGLRWSFFEAREALSRGPGVNEREPLSLTGLLLASQDLPIRELGEDVLRPLLEFDASHGGGLVATLRAFLEADGSVRTVAARLFVHRNTVRYRLAQVERLTGRSLDSTQDRVQLWLALQAVSVAGPVSQVR